MKILFCVPRIHTNYSGMIDSLLKLGHKLSFITMTKNEISIPLESDISVYQFEPKKRFFIPNYRTKQLHFEGFSDLKKVFQKEKPDLVIVRDFRLINVQISLISKLNSIPVILYDQIPFDYNKTLKKRIWYTAARYLISKNRMTTVGKDALANRKKDSNTFFIPFAVPKTKIKKYYPTKITPNNPLKIIVISKLDTERKNLIFLLKSLAPLLNDNLVKVSLYGLLRDNLNRQKHFDKLCKFINNHNYDDHISIFPNEKYESVLDSYSNHDLFILPSLSEPAAISPFEAMSSGLPVIVTKQNGTNYIVEHRVNGIIIDPKNKESILNSVLFFINHPKNLKEYGITSLKKINNHYRPKNFSKNISEILNTVTK